MVEPIALWSPRAGAFLSLSSKLKIVLSPLIDQTISEIFRETNRFRINSIEI